ncbi:insulinase family protein [Akkermansia sp. N21169]|jgi:zinc protease|uniref:M16 family metallopeptidase n=1 Tax=Akkermansia sp. N21169 TaxID=3040765 RepID=UPI00244EDD5E|nr:M16 family metallopeptidase [Akkermansia sp. N21169]MDH3069134.1 insulinase family protein [Akkermansia sp. N21169]
MRYLPVTPILVAAVSLVSTGALHADEQHADASATEATALKQANETNTLQQDPRIVSGVLPNGLEYFIRPNLEPKGRMSLKLRVNTGSLNEVEENRGISHFLEHMVFNGSNHFKRGEIMEVMQRHGLGLGGDANAYTSFDETVYMLELPSLKPDTVDLAFTILRDFADGAHLDESAINSERGIITSEYRVRDSAQQRMMQEALGFLLDGTIVAERMPIGTLDFINKGPRSLFLDYYKTHYTPDNMQLVIVGDITPEQGKEWVEKYFSSMTKTPEGPAKGDWGSIKPYKGVAAKWISNKDASGTEVSLVNAKAHATEADTVEKRIKDLTDDAAMAMLNRRLAELTKKEDCPFIKAGMGKDTMFQLADLSTLTANTTPDKWRQTLSVLEQELRRAQQYGFSKNEVEDIIKDMVNDAQVAVQSWETNKSADLSGSIAQSIAQQEVFTDPREDMRVLQKAIADKAITPENCQKALQKILDLKNIKITVSGKEANPNGDKDIVKAFEASSSVPVEARAEEARTPFAYDHIGEPGKVVSSKEDPRTGARQIVLSNGIRVNLKPTEFDKDIIRVQAEIDGGSVTMPKGSEALSILAPVIVNNGGLEAHSIDDLARLMAGHAVKSGFSISDERFNVSGETTPKDLELELKLIAAQLMHSGYRPEAEITFRRSIPLLYDMLGKKPEGLLQKEGMEFLYNNNGKFHFPERRELEKLTTADVKNWIDPALKNNYMEVSLVGDFKPDDVIPILERTIGALPKRQDAPAALNQDSLKVSFADSGSAKDISYPSSIDRTLVCTVWPTSDGKDAQKARELKLMKDILRERLFKGIREKMGEAYSPFVLDEASLTYPDNGYMMSVAPGVLANKDKVAKAVMEITGDLAKGTITEDEFSRALKPLINRVERALRDNGFWLSAISKSQSKPESVDRAVDALKGYKAITVDDMNKLAKEIFKPGREISINIIPDIQEPAKTGDGEKKKSDQAVAPSAAISVLARPAKQVVKKTGNNSPYIVLVSEETKAMPEWMAVAEALKAKHNAKILTYKGTPDSALPALKKEEVRYMALVAPPEQIDRNLVNKLHRLTRKIDDDPYGDCIWGIITGFTPDDAMRIAKASEPLTITRAQGTTNVDASRFTDSMCITDWGPYEFVEQHGHQEAKVQPFPESDKGVVPKFAEFWEKSHPELVVTSSHATQYNLEMPFGKGLIVSYDNKFHLMGINQKKEYASFLKGVLFDGKEEELASYIQQQKPPVLAHDATPKVWIAAGNCLFGDTKKTRNSMAVTALSGYGCNQLVGYTVPSWYGKGGWGTLSLIFNNHDKSSFSEAWYLNNQFILDETLRKYPALINVDFNASSINAIKEEDPGFMEAMTKANCGLGQEQMGLVHDRDVVAFYGDPVWVARLDESHTKSPWSVTWNDAEDPAKGLTVTANADYNGRFAVWFPKRLQVKKADITIDGKKQPLTEVGTLTNDFILIPDLKLGRKQQAEITF